MMVSGCGSATTTNNPVAAAAAELRAISLSAADLETQPADS